jgi:signal transduction histidine kinase
MTMEPLQGAPAFPASSDGRFHAADEFLATIIHELRSPLGCIKGYVSALLSPGGLDDERTARRWLAVIEDASDELNELVQRLFELAKAGAAALDVHPQPVGLPSLVRAAIERLGPRLRNRSIAMAIPPRLPLVSADPRRIEQVLANVLDNAVKYSPDTGKVTVTTVMTTGHVIVSVADEGIGVPPALLRELFQRYRREQTARTAGIEGTGLGLAICRGIVEAHGGRIWVESPVPGREADPCPGTIVSFTLPLAGALGMSRGRVRSRRPATPAIAQEVAA